MKKIVYLSAVLIMALSITMLTPLQSIVFNGAYAQEASDTEKKDEGAGDAEGKDKKAAEEEPDC